MNPNQVALQNRAALEATGIYRVEPDGRVRDIRTNVPGAGGYVPPWVWSQDLHGAATAAMKTPPGDPSSAWHGMDQSNGPFSHPAAWNSEEATYDTQLDWPTLLGTIGAGSVIGGGVSALPVFAGGAAALPAASGASGLSATSLGLPATAGLGTAGGATAAVGGIPAAFGSTAVDTVTSAAPAAGAGFGLPDWLSVAQGVGNALGGASEGRAQGRLAEGDANQRQANAATNLYNAQLAAPSRIARNAVRGDVLANAQDVNIAAPSTIPVPQITGGLRPSMYSPATRQLGQSITANAAATPLPIPQPPVLPNLPQASGLDTGLNTASTIASLIGAAKPLTKIPWGKLF